MDGILKTYCQTQKTAVLKWKIGTAVFPAELPEINDHNLAVRADADRGLEITRAG